MTAQLAHGTNPPQSHKERFIRLARRAPSLSSWHAISINRSFFWHNYARTHIHGLGRICKALGVELWPHKVEQLMKKHATTELYFSFPPKKPGPCDYLLINQTDTCFFAVALLIKTLSHTKNYYSAQEKGSA